MGSIYEYNTLIGAVITMIGIVMIWLLKTVKRKITQHNCHHDYDYYRICKHCGIKHLKVENGKIV